ncbi:SDR family oxidoreductase [Synoicihabitans lomoniglobus]|uniref:SDR family NAD(P)-dependent oxidoreductase n=1 Tax=Synoicihabitans lomoniglobus TaxID=2909285 RepID=A0AAF0CRT6_9BACT|nr:SDR family oxidoreductase [Opitutaceae bacterium LMO-M01]WED66801.1 SDR family NAD(P)-dependent oxidoreductase [Opitutaceae bacterium LMO-M01]
MNDTPSPSPSHRTVLITGAGTGIGAALALRLAHAGWTVIIAGRRPEKLEEVAANIRAAGGTVTVVVGDVTMSADVARMVAAAGPSLDLLVHSAGQGHCLTIDELDEQEFRETLNVATVGAFLTAKLALPKLRAGQSGAGHIIQIASLASGGTWNREVGYGTAKGAQAKFALHLTSQMEVDAAAGGRRIHVHAVCPGTVDTPFWDRVPNRPIDRANALTGDEVAWMTEAIINDPAATWETLSAIKPRAEIVIKPHAPFERWSNVIAVAHESHP